jgi:hypothetical protein
MPDIVVSRPLHTKIAFLPNISKSVLEKCKNIVINNRLRYIVKYEFPMDLVVDE